MGIQNLRNNGIVSAIRSSSSSTVHNHNIKDDLKILLIILSITNLQRLLLSFINICCQLMRSDQFTQSGYSLLKVVMGFRNLLANWTSNIEHTPVGWFFISLNLSIWIIQSAELCVQLCDPSRKIETCDYSTEKFSLRQNRRRESEMFPFAICWKNVQSASLRIRQG